ncbi:MAG TPA: deoxynucleoside kinase [Candidatus Binatia bacterium]|jgi:thymidylate kinase|nr:deoxynucleoside kinase [Candidatus Binatia bacterium]
MSKELRLPRFAERKVSCPFIVALEGANGAGKTTLCRTLSHSLDVPRCLGTDEAWFSASFKTRMIRDAAWYASAMFFLSGCFEQMRVLSRRRERLVIMDRSLWSTLAVHAATSAARFEALLAMLRPIAAEVRVPDLTIVLEASFATCQSRIARKTGPARALDGLTATAPFHAREQEFYRWLGRNRPEIVFLDANRRSPEKVAEMALALVRKKARC